MYNGGYIKTSLALGLIHNKKIITHSGSKALNFIGVILTNRITGDKYCVKNHHEK